MVMMSEPPFATSGFVSYKNTNTVVAEAVSCRKQFLSHSSRRLDVVPEIGISLY